MQLERKGYLPQLRELAMGLCAPFFWSTGTGPSSRVLNNGTVCYLDSGTKKIGVTANHVYSKYEQHLREFADLECQFGGSTIRPEERLIDRSEALDLATFDIPEFFAVGGHKSFHEPTEWPPKAAGSSDIVLYGGYPGTLKEMGTDQIAWPFQNFTWCVTDVTERNVVMHVDWSNLYWPGHEQDTIPQNPAGISGGPVFRVIESPITRLEIVGIVYEYFEPFETVRARHIGCIQSDGRLIRQ